MIATSAPDLANCEATAKPMPLLPPVTTAERPARVISMNASPNVRCQPRLRATMRWMALPDDALVTPSSSRMSAAESAPDTMLRSNAA